MPARPVQNPQRRVVHALLQEPGHVGEVALHLHPLRRPQQRAGPLGQMSRQGGQERRLIAEHQPDPVLETHRIGDAQAGIGIGAQRLPGLRLDPSPFACVAGMEHGGDAGADHPQIRVQGVQVEVEGRHAPVVEDPAFQEVVGDAELDARESASVVVRVDEARQHQVAAGPEGLGIGEAAAQGPPFTDLLDLAAADEHRAVFQHPGCGQEGGIRHHVTAPKEFPLHLALLPRAHTTPPEREHPGGEAPPGPPPAVSLPLMVAASLPCSPPGAPSPAACARSRRAAAGYGRAGARRRFPPSVPAPGTPPGT